MKPKAVITGATGLIGRATLAPLSQHFQVMAVCRQVPANKLANIEYVGLDLEDQSAVTAFFKKHRPTHLIHAAWARTGEAGLWHAPENEYWVEVSENLVRAFRQAGGERAVVCGTCAEYKFESQPLHEEKSSIEPDTLYGRAKVELHQCLADFAKQSGLQLVWPRLFFLYGPGENESRLVPSVIKKLHAGERCPCSHGQQIRDYTYIGDIGEGLARLLASPFEGAINLASGQEMTLSSLIFKIGALLDRSNLIEMGALPARDGEPPYIVANTQKLEQVLGWVPTTGLDSGLRQMIEFEKQKPSVNEGGRIQ